MPQLSKTNWTNYNTVSTTTYDDNNNNNNNNNSNPSGITSLNDLPRESTLFSLRKNNQSNSAHIPDSQQAKNSPTIDELSIPDNSLSSTNTNQELSIPRNASKSSNLTKVSSHPIFEPYQFSHTSPENGIVSDEDNNVQNICENKWKVWKFGGTSMGSAERISNVANLVTQEIKSGSDLAVVVSAVGGITSALQKCCDKAAHTYSRIRNEEISFTNNNEDEEFISSFTYDLHEIEKIHIKIMNDLYNENKVSEETKNKFICGLKKDMISISSILSALELSGKHLKDLNDFVIGQGEIWSSQILYSCLPHFLDNAGLLHSSYNVNKHSPSCKNSLESTPTCNNKNVSSNSRSSILTNGTHSRNVNVITHLSDTRDFLVVYDRSDPETAFWFSNYTKDQVFLNWATSSAQLNSHLRNAFPPRVSQAASNNTITSSLSQQEVPSFLMIMTGFICSYPNGSMTNLGRNGSDYSASLISSLLKSKELTIWSDVAGIYSADPRQIPGAVFISQLSYNEALELSYFGAKVLHPFSILPCIQNNIPILLRSSFSPALKGSVICDSSHSIPHQSNSVLGCKAFSMTPNIALVTLEGTHMIGVPGIASKLFSSLNAASCSVILISQGSSEHSICVAINSSDLKTALLSINSAFNVELLITKTMNLYYIDSCTILSAVGEGMSGYIGTLSKLAAALSAASVNIKVVTQGPSELNISFVVDEKDGLTGLKALHNSVYSQQSEIFGGKVSETSPPNSLVQREFTTTVEYSSDIAIPTIPSLKISKSFKKKSKKSLLRRMYLTVPSLKKIRLW